VSYMTHPFCDIVIPIHGALDDLKECLSTLQAHTRDYRLILVDDCSEREVTNFLLDFGQANPSTILIRTFRQRWFTRASNLGMRLLRTERSVLLNSDCVLDEGWLEELFAVWDDFQVQNPQRRIGLVGSVLSAEEPRRYADIVQSGYVTGHAWLFSVSAFYDVSASRGMPGFYLDETKVGAAHIHSDREMCWDLNRLGMATLMSFKSAVGHKGGRSWGHNLALLTGLNATTLDMNR